ncbi:MAG: NAD-dependent epimerase/dehydratase family protein [Candidatus Zixiibacteriota bacterium]|nr:MAG: NAD-dependent epimerase/dehydratase family protein [candidate division Zixibacteria bacterium]
MIKTVMVTGSSGTVGTALVQDLIQKRFNVIPLDIKHSYWDRRIDRDTVFWDLRKPMDRLRVRKIPDIIVHLASNARVHDLVVDPQKALDNYIMTHNILEFARHRGVKRFVFASSREVYGESGAGRKRAEDSTHVTRIKSPYTASKFASEALIHSYHECYGIKPVIVRLSNVYGRYDVSERAVPLFIYYARRNRQISIFGGEKALDFTYTDDAIDGLTLIVKKFDRVAPNTLNITAGKSARIIDVARIIIEKIGSQSKIVVGKKRTGEISRFVADISRARRLLGYKPKVSLEVGLEKNIDWYLEVMKIRKIYEAQRRDLMRRGWA